MFYLTRIYLTNADLLELPAITNTMMQRMSDLLTRMLNTAVRPGQEDDDEENPAEEEEGEGEPVQSGGGIAFL